jgi:TetR/AcrR family transcriptional regulator
MSQSVTASQQTRRAPRIGQRRQDRGARSRAAILSAAERLFAGSGVDGTRTETIAAEAGVNKALLYYYFESKDALYEAVLENHAREFYQRAAAVLDFKEKAGDVVLAYVGMSFDFIAARPYFAALIQRLSMSGARPLERLARKYSAPLADRLAEVIERGVRAGEFRRVDPEHTVISLAALTRFYFAAAPIVRAVTGRDPYEADNIRRRRNEVLEFVRYGLFRNPEAHSPCASC